MTNLETINFIVSLVLVALVIIAILRKIDIVLTFIVLSIVGLIYMSLMKHASVLGTLTLGNWFLDIFTYLENSMAKTYASAVIIVSVIMGYMAYVDKASDMFGALIRQPLKKVKNKMLLVALVMIAMLPLKFVIFPTIPQAALVFATLYPLLMAVGITRATAASAIMFTMGVTWGPTHALTYMLWTIGKVTSMTVPEYFVKYEIINIAVSFTLAIIVFVITSKIFDKREKATGDDRAQNILEPKSYGLPYIYAVFPFLPVIIVIIFSKLVIANATIGVIGATLLSYVILMICELIRAKDKKQAMKDTRKFWIGAGNIMENVGSLVIAAGFFASLIADLGGFNAFFKQFISSNAGGSMTFVIIFGSVAAALFMAATSNAVGTITLFGSIFNGLAASTGTSMVTIIKTLLPVSSIGAALAPASSGNLFVAAQSDVPIMRLIKRTLAPTIVFAISSIIMTTMVLI